MGRPTTVTLATTSYLTSSYSVESWELPPAIRREEASSAAYFGFDPAGDPYEPPPWAITWVCKSTTVAGCLTLVSALKAALVDGVKLTWGEESAATTLFTYLKTCEAPTVDMQGTWARVVASGTRDPYWYGTDVTVGDSTAQGPRRYDVDSVLGDAPALTRWTISADSSGVFSMVGMGHALSAGAKAVCVQDYGGHVVATCLGGEAVKTNIPTASTWTNTGTPTTFLATDLTGAWVPFIRSGMDLTVANRQSRILLKHGSVVAVTLAGYTIGSEADPPELLDNIYAPQSFPVRGGLYNSSGTYTAQAQAYFTGVTIPDNHLDYVGLCPTSDGYVTSTESIGTDLHYVIDCLSPVPKDWGVYDNGAKVDSTSTILVPPLLHPGANSLVVYHSSGVPNVTIGVTYTPRYLERF